MSPGVSFVCAFDPVVVGRVLGVGHPGFGDGLKFLDKSSTIRAGSQN